ncbi:MAG: site-2 protease family protein [Gammaproteobacteria bacterium]
MELSLVQQIAVWALPVLFAITLHEVAHGWMARSLGDRTAEMLGRLSLNPFKHIDPIGTVLVPVILLLIGGFIFGWARPVPIAARNLKNPKRDMALVAVAGPAANLLMMMAWALIVRIAGVFGDYAFFSKPLIYMGMAGIMINSVLLAFNLLPIPPLDGSRVLAAFLPPRLSAQYEAIAPYGLIILMALLFLGVISPVLGPLVNVFLALARVIAGG